MIDSLSYNSFALTDKGCRRTINEDAYLVADDAALWAVADGMGGHNAGDRAANILVDTLKGYHPGVRLADSLDALQQLLRTANQTIYETAHAAPQPVTMGTTLALLALQGDGAIAIWVGDSRLYRLRGGVLTQMTSDHSLVQEMVDRGELSPAEAQRHPSANVITRAIGATASLLPEVSHAEVQAGDRYLLCSDGLHRYIEPELLKTMLAQPDISACGRGLIDYSLAQGGRDNVTAVLIDLHANNP